MIPKHLRSKTGVNKLLIKILKFETMLILNKLVKLEKNYKSVFKISQLYVLCCKIALAASIDGDFDNFHTIKMTYRKLPVIPHPLLLYIGTSSHSPSFVCCNFHTIKMTYRKLPVIPHPLLLYIGSHELYEKDSSISKLTVTMPQGPLL